MSRRLSARKRCGARPYEARSQAGLAAALRARGENERAAAVEAAAAATASELGMTRLEHELAAATPGRLTPRQGSLAGVVADTRCAPEGTSHDTPSSSLELAHRAT